MSPENLNAFCSAEPDPVLLHSGDLDANTTGQKGARDSDNSPNHVPLYTAENAAVRREQIDPYGCSDFSRSRYRDEETGLVDIHEPG